MSEYKNAVDIQRLYKLVNSISSSGGSVVTGSGVSGTEVSGAITGAISNFPTRVEVSGALSNYATKTAISSSITGAISNFPTRVEVSGAVTGGTNFLTSSVARINSLYVKTLDVTGAFSLDSPDRSNITVSGNNLDLFVTGNNASGAQLLLSVTNSVSSSQIVGVAGTYTFLGAGTSGSWPYYFFADTQNKFVAIEAEDVSGAIYVGGGNVASSVHIGTSLSRIITIGNLNTGTQVRINSDYGTNVSGTARFANDVYVNTLYITGSSSLHVQSPTYITGNIYVTGNMQFIDGTITGVSFASPADVTGALSDYPTKTAVSSSITGALTPYWTGTKTATEVSGAVTASKGGWASITLATGYSDGSEKAEARLDGHNTVWIRGSVSANGTNTAALGTLPSNMYPPSKQYFICYESDQVGYQMVSFDTDGSIACDGLNGLSTTVLSLQGIVYTLDAQ